MNTVKINNETYRITGSTMSQHSILKTAYNRLGVTDRVNALGPRSRTKQVQLFIMADGSARIADSRLERDAMKLAQLIKKGAA